MDSPEGVVRSARGQDSGPLWSVELPPEDVGILVALPDGSCLVCTQGFLASVSAPGRVDWLVEIEQRELLPWAAVPVPGGRLISAESGALVVRRQDTGAAVGTLGHGFRPSIVMTPDGDLIYATWTRVGGGTLRRVSLEGQERWRTPLELRMPYESLICAGQLAITDGDRTQGFDLDGRPRWWAGRRGFQVDRPAGQEPSEETIGPLMAVGSGSFLALHRSTWAGLHLYDVHEQVVSEVRTDVPVSWPVTVVHRDGRPTIAGAGPVREPEPQRLVFSVVQVDLDGRLLWEHPIPIIPGWLVPEPAGNLFVVCSPGLDRWDKYHRWYDLSHQCFARRLGPDGSVLSTWRFPRPLSYQPALGRDGELFVAASGRLWALG